MEVKHSYDFYKLIGDEEKQFLEEEKKKYAGKDKDTEKPNIIFKPPPEKKFKVLGMGGNKPIKKGKMKNEK